MTVPKAAGETTITGRGQVSLPAQSMRDLGWARGDRLIVETLGRDMIVLIRRPVSWTDEFAGRLSDVFGTPEESSRFLAGERESWERGGEPADEGNDQVA